jgi:hypothetical protein
VIIGYLNVIGIAIDKAEANAPLIIYGYNVLAFSRSSQGMQKIAGRYPEIFQSGRNGHTPNASRFFELNPGGAVLIYL